MGRPGSDFSQRAEKEMIMSNVEGMIPSKRPFKNLTDPHFQAVGFFILEPELVFGGGAAFSFFAELEAMDL